MFSFKSIFTFVILSFLINLTGLNSYAQTKIKVGTYDSRLIAIAYYNSKLFKLPMESHEKIKIAREKNDTAAITDIGKEMSLRQRFMHEQGFGKASVCYLLEEIKDKVAEYVKKEKLDFIVSKWDLSFINPDFEVVDITLNLANLFEPLKNMDTLLDEASKTEPIKDAFLIED